MNLTILTLLSNLLLANYVLAESHVMVKPVRTAPPTVASDTSPRVTQSFSVLPEDNDAVDYDGRELLDIKIKNAVTLLENSSCAKQITEEVASLLNKHAEIDKVLKQLTCQSAGQIQSIDFKLVFEKSSQGSCDGRAPLLKIKMASAFKDDIVMEQATVELEPLNWTAIQIGINTACETVIAKHFSEVKVKKAKELELFKKNPLSKMPVLLNFFKQT